MGRLHPAFASWRIGTAVGYLHAEGKRLVTTNYLLPNRRDGGKRLVTATVINQKG